MFEKICSVETYFLEAWKGSERKGAEGNGEGESPMRGSGRGEEGKEWESDEQGNVLSRQGNRRVVSGKWVSGDDELGD